MTAAPKGESAEQSPILYAVTNADFDAPEDALIPDMALTDAMCFDGPVAVNEEPQEWWIPPELSTDEAKKVVSDWYKEEIAATPLPTHVRLKATQAVDMAQDFGRESVSIGRLLRNAYDGARLPNYQYQQFIRAVMSDGRLSHQDGGNYAFNDPSILPVPKPKVNRAVITACVESVVEKTAPGETVRMPNLLGFAKHAGHMLTRDEVDAFFVAVASDPRITPEESGDFTNNGTAIDSDPFAAALDLTEEHIYSQRDVALARRFSPRSSYRALLRPSKRSYTTLTRGADHVNPGKFQEAQSWQMQRARRQNRSPR